MPPYRPPRPLNDFITQRTGQRERAESLTIGPNHIYGFIDVQGAGEVAVEVNFPVWFIERPGMYFGGELAENFAPEEGNFPTVSVVVGSWKKVTRNYTEYFVGATLLIVTTGAFDHAMTVHWHAEAKALTNPRADTPGLDEQL